MHRDILQKQIYESRIVSGVTNITKKIRNQKWKMNNKHRFIQMSQELPLSLKTEKEITFVDPVVSMVADV